MKRFILILPLFFILVTSCSPDKITEGEIEYEITYPNENVTPLIGAILPKTMTVVFQGTKTITRIARGKLFSTEIITDEADQSVEMRLDFDDKLFYTILTKAEIDEMIASQPIYELNATGEQDSLFGMFASAYSLKCKGDTIVHPDAWFTEDLIHANAFWYTSYAAVNGFPLIYDVERYGVMMHVNVSKFTKREVLESEFDRAPNLVKVSFKEYEAEVQALFDSLMN